MRAPDADVLSGKLTALIAQLADNAEAIELATEILFDPKRKNLHKKADARRKVLEAERQALEAQRDTLTAQRAEGGALGELLDQARRGPVAEDFAGIIEWGQRFADAFAEFPLEKKRDKIAVSPQDQARRTWGGSYRTESHGVDHRRLGEWIGLAHSAVVALPFPRPDRMAAVVRRELRLPFLVKNFLVRLVLHRA